MRLDKQISADAYLKLLAHRQCRYIKLYNKLITSFVVVRWFGELKSSVDVILAARSVRFDHSL